MKVAVPTEVKDNEFRVALTPGGVRELVAHGHEVLVQEGAGVGSAFGDDEYKEAGARLVADADAVWGEAEMVVKVKEPVAPEYHRLRDDLTLFTYLHLAASRECTQALLDAGTTAIAYETVTRDGGLPLLAPMSEVAGRLAPQVGAYHLMRSHGGRGLLLGGVPGAPAAHVVVIGGGVSGAAAIQMAVGMHARVTVLDTNLDTLRALDARYAGRVQTLYSNTDNLERAVLDADLVVGAVLIPGARAPKLVGNDLVRRMKAGAVLVDIAIDQGGCFEDSHPTTHSDPTFAVHDTLFYCVANMPGAVPNTSTHALTHATTPFVLALADRGWRQASADDAGLAAGLATHAGELYSRTVGEAHELPVSSLA
ncbi:alanine dehydrogenase [Actinomycetospora sp. NBRC 106378]|uniref:alanine dehydrogenase n=1 Tax=Actinomycetospora sp. NBRC 106378 TaxID=3032208 RepID=UPI0024A45B7B|nr:alanine dehydrogenase [Actinomycetospora sp. NBRC 106378]GLZ50414.1 alanine dehydrogenase [Actinomycetospora sp. NBRC 106378]